MASETITTNSDEPVVEPTVEEQPVVVEDIDETEPLEEAEPVQEQPPVEDDSDDGWQDYAKQHGLEYQSPDELIEAHKALLAAQRQPQRDPEPQPQPRMAQPQQAPTDKQESFYNYTPAKAILEQWKQQGMASEEVARSYEPFAAFVDSALKPEFEKTAKVLDWSLGQLQKMTKELRGLQWNALPDEIRKQVKRSDVEALMSSFDFEDMRSAATHHITKTRPDLLSKLFDKGKEEGERAAANRKRFRFGQQRSSTPASKPDTSWQKYISSNGEVDQSALNRLSIDDRLKVLDQIEKATKPK